MPRKYSVGKGWPRICTTYPNFTPDEIDDRKPSSFAARGFSIRQKYHSMDNRTLPRIHSTPATLQNCANYSPLRVFLLIFIFSGPRGSFFRWNASCRRVCYTDMIRGAVKPHRTTLRLTKNGGGFSQPRLSCSSLRVLVLERALRGVTYSTSIAIDGLQANGGALDATTGILGHASCSGRPWKSPHKCI